MCSSSIEMINKQHKKESKSSFNITGGRYKGKRLYMHSNITTRPTKALVKKSFFDSMQDIIPNCIFIECFAGSGQMGFEAISRGAKKAIFFEKDLIAYNNLQENLRLFRCRENASTNHKNDMKILKSQSTLSLQSGQQIESYSIDFFDSSSILEDLSNLSEHIVMYLDPPFPSNTHDSSNVYDNILFFMQTFSNAFLHKIHILIIELMSNYPIYENIANFHISKISKFGKTTLIYFKH